MDLSNIIRTDLGASVQGKRKKRPRGESQQLHFLPPIFVVFPWHGELHKDPLPRQTLVRVLNLLPGVSVHTPPLQKSTLPSLLMDDQAQRSPLMSDHIGLSLARISIGWIKQTLPQPRCWLLVSFHLLIPFSSPSLARGNNLFLYKELRPISCLYAKCCFRCSHTHLKVLNKVDLMPCFSTYY